MVLERNPFVNVNIKEVQLKQVGLENELLPYFTKVYSTPSKIKFARSSKHRPGGVEYINKITLQYPGVSDTSFSLFHKLLYIRFVAQIKYTSNALFQIGGNDIPLKLSINYKNPVGTILTFSNKSIEPLKELGVVSENEVVGFPYRLKASL